MGDTKTPVTLGQGVEFLTQLLRECEKQGVAREQFQPALDNPEMRKKIIENTLAILSGKKPLGNRRKIKALVLAMKTLIPEELEVVSNYQYAALCWGNFAITGEIHPRFQGHYDQIFSADHTRKEYEPLIIGELKREMFALCLANLILEPVIRKDMYNGQWRMEPWYFVRIVISNEKRHATWTNVKRLLDPIIHIFPYYLGRLPEIDARLLSRLTGIDDTTTDKEVEKQLLAPLREIVGLPHDAPPSLIEKTVTELVNGAWKQDLWNTVRQATTRVENILKSVPDPKMIPCYDALQRIVEIYESEPRKTATSVRTLEDATILEHVENCRGPCTTVKRCVGTGIDYVVVREWAEHPRTYTELAIRDAKEYLANLKT